jgi:hypothetical protein
MPKKLSKARPTGLLLDFDGMEYPRLGHYEQLRRTIIV